MIEPTANTLKYAPWSISKADTAKQCPRKFNLQYVNKPGTKAAPNLAALVGKTVHRIVEYALAGQHINKCFEFAIEEFKLTTNEEEVVLGFRPMVSKFLKRFKLYKQKYNGFDPELEERLAVTIDWKPTSFFSKEVFFRGVLDLCMRIRKKPHAVIIDHKTGKYRDLEHYKAQFDAYMLLKKAQEPHLTGCQVGINFLKEDRLEFVRGLQDVRDVVQLGNRVMTYLNEATTDLDDLTVVRPGPLCGWCDFREGCSACVEGTNGKKEEN